MKFVNNNKSYTVDFFFGRTGESKKQMDETTTCVRATTGEAFNIAEYDWPNEESQYANIFEELCNMAIHEDKTIAEIKILARRLANE